MLLVKEDSGIEGRRGGRGGGGGDGSFYRRREVIPPRYSIPIKSRNSQGEGKGRKERKTGRKKRKLGGTELLSVSRYSSLLHPL
jgi:hypothetical protein